MRCVRPDQACQKFDSRTLINRGLAPEVPVGRDEDELFDALHRQENFRGYAFQEQGISTIYLALGF